MTDDEIKPHHGEKELAQFIRAGAQRRPDQAFGDYYRGRSASCALGPPTRACIACRSRPGSTA